MDVGEEGVEDAKVGDAVVLVTAGGQLVRGLLVVHMLIDEDGDKASEKAVSLLLSQVVNGRCLLRRWP